MALVEGSEHIGRYVNPAFCNLLDKNKEDLIGKPFVEILPKHDKCTVLLDRVFASGLPASHTEEEHSHTHPLFWSYTMWPVSIDQRTIGVMIQVTETAELREKTLAMNEQLMLAAVRQHEMIEEAAELNARLLVEINRRTLAEDALLREKLRLDDHNGVRQGM
ncbi:MAG TPA: PAS domain-containing protein [Candidatus Methylacidiphilales bacterium]